MATLSKKQFESSAMVAKVTVSHDLLSEEKEKDSNIEPNRNELISSIAVVDHSCSDGEFIRAEDCITSILVKYAETIRERSSNHLGYALNLCNDHYVSLAPLLRFHINNCGDPFTDLTLSLHSREFEVGVLDWFAQLWEIEKDEYWGYVTNGGTESNLHALWIGREMLPDGILYASQESHYSIYKAARMYRMKCVKVDTLINGEIDCVDFRRKLLLNKDKPAIIIVNFGTTFKGAIDDLDLIIRTLEECGFAQDRFHIHCDAALFGIMLPFIKHGPKISFKKPIGSASVSGHKFLGCTMPCGVQMTRKKHIDFIFQKVDYMSTTDATISGSRNGHSPIFLWYSLSKKGKIGLEKDVETCLENARNFKNWLTKAGIRSMLNEWSIIVVFEKPDDKIVSHWQLSCTKDLAHVVVLPNVTMEKLNALFQDLISAKILGNKDCKIQQPNCLAKDIRVDNCACRNDKEAKTCRSIFPKL